ncbi:MAG TPA: hypothetical protein GXZ47_05350 [Treponema sp.]|nr:hypothetical protein [Treponema sp.]
MSTKTCVPYSFTEQEIKSLALLLRKHEAVLDNKLDAFRLFIENAVYQAMTIAEAEDFYNEEH